MRIKAGTLAVVIAATFAITTSAFGADGLDFTWQPSQPIAGQEVTFTATGGGKNATYLWDLNGDGVYGDATGSTVKLTFSAARDYTVGVQIDNGEDTVEKVHTVHVSSNLKASFTWDPSAPVVGQPVTFTSTSTASGASVNSYAWDLVGDHKFKGGSTASVTRTFDKAGSYTIGLRVGDTSGARAFTFDTVQVADAPPPPSPPPAAPSAPADNAAAPKAVQAPAAVGPAWLNPFPSIRIRGFATTSGVRVTMLAVRAPDGTKVVVRCKGTACGKARRAYVVKGSRIRLTDFERYMPASTQLELFIWKPGKVGRYTRFEMRRLVAPKRVDKCLFPGTKGPQSC